MNDNTSWIKLHRRITKWGWYTDSKMVHLFLHLLLNANYKQSEWRGEKIERGQILTGRKQLSVDTGITEQSIRTCLKNLELTKEITIKSTNKFSVITVVNYEVYQEKGDELTSKLTSKLTNNQPTTNQQLTTSKEEKERKNFKEEVKDILLEKETKDLFNNWLDYRKEIKKPIKSDKTLIALAKKIKLEGHKRSKEVITASIENGWQGLFWDKQKNNNNGKSSDESWKELTNY